MNVLAFDTTGPVVGVSLCTEHGTLVRTERVRRGAESRLVPWAQELLAEAGLGPADLQGVGVSLGPGAFTGLRVGLATALGWAMALELPVWGCDSLLPRAHRSGQSDVLVLIDARKSRVYAARVVDGVRQGDILDIPPTEALAGLPPGLLVTGEGALAYAALVEEAGLRVAPDADAPGIASLAVLAAAALRRGEGVDAAAVEPIYIRAPDAKVPRDMESR